MARSRLEESRAALTSSIADLLQGISEAKARAPLPKSDSDEDAAQRPAVTLDQERDPWLDLLRLQHDYGLELRKLGRAYFDHNIRSLRLLDRFLGSRSNGAGTALEFTAEAPLQRFEVSNDADPEQHEATIRCTPFRSLRTGATQLLPVSFRCAEQPLVDGRFSLPFGEPVTLTVSVPVEQLSGGRRFRAELQIQLGERVRRIAIAVEKQPQAVQP